MRDWPVSSPVRQSLPAFDPAALPQLACPACHGELRVEAATLFCAACRRAYPVVDGIPVLIAERADSHRRLPGRR